MTSIQSRDTYATTSSIILKVLRRFGGVADRWPKLSASSYGVLAFILVFHRRYVFLQLEVEFIAVTCTGYNTYSRVGAATPYSVYLHMYNYILIDVRLNLENAFSC